MVGVVVQNNGYEVKVEGKGNYLYLGDSLCLLEEAMNATDEDIDDAGKLPSRAQVRNMLYEIEMINLEINCNSERCIYQRGYQPV